MRQYKRQIKSNLLTKINALNLSIELLEERLRRIKLKLYSRDLFGNGSYNLDKKYEETRDLLNGKITEMENLYNKLCKLN